MGYTGGQKTAPNYHSLGNHTEALQVDFDPNQVSYLELVNMIWSSHNPIGAPRSSQYKSAIWFANDQQRDAINATIVPLEAKLQQKLTTEVLPLGPFYLAEEYHQKYCLQRHRGLMSTYKSMFVEFQEFVDSTSAARLNGFAGGYGRPALFEDEKSSYGHELSELAVLRR